MESSQLPVEGVETKQQLLDEIARISSVPACRVAAGSSIPRLFFESLVERFGLLLEGDMVALARRLVAEAGLAWPPTGDSRSSPSGGGGTVTLEGLKAVRNAVTVLLHDEVQSAEPGAGIVRARSQEWTLIPGQQIMRAQLHERYGGDAAAWLSVDRHGRNLFLIAAPGRLPVRDAGDDLALSLSLSTAHRAIWAGRSVMDLLFGQPLPLTVRLFEQSAGGWLTYLKALVPAARLDNPVLPEDGEKVGVTVFLRSWASQTPGSPQHLGEELAPLLFGQAYRPATPTRIANPAEPFTIDPDEMDRATKAHAATQELIAAWLVSGGQVPLSPAATDPQFDIGWVSQGVRYVAEVKSTTSANEVQQFRLGLGQALDYAASLDARAVVVLSRRPETARLLKVASRCRVVLLWPDLLDQLSPTDLQSAVKPPLTRTTRVGDR